MTKLNTSIRGSLILAFTTIVLTLVLGYSVLSARYFLDGMDTIVADNLMRAAITAASTEKHNDIRDRDINPAIK